jgi:GAF domain-containing protein
VPLLGDGIPIGTINLRREVVKPFGERQIALLETLADQAVVAIENVRLFTELEARNRDLTAAGEVLQVISRSPTDTQPVFDTIAERAVNLCSAAFGAVFRFNDGWSSIAALNGMRPEETEAAQRFFPRRVTGNIGLSRVALTGELVHIPDVQADPEWRASTAGPAFSVAAGFRTCLIVPLNREGLCLGAINVWRREAAPFSVSEIALLQTFADQAVIAIENVRLFTELDARNRDLTNALEQQTATAEILRVIGSSPTEVQPVFDAIVTSAV